MTCYHNHTLANCPSGFHVLAESNDGEIEAIRYFELPWEGWMWHPEGEKEFSKRDAERFRGLLKT